MDIRMLVETQRAYFKTHQTKGYAFRMAALKRLEEWITHHEDAISAALKADLKKAEMESYFSEIGMVKSELREAQKHLKKWMKKKYVTTPLAQFKARSYILQEPYGNVLIMSPWNYPFLLSIDPLIGAIAAGNCAIVKPSAYAPAVSHVIAEMMTACFDEAYVAVVEGGRTENTALLDQRFDLIFFTGSVNVGKLVMEKASRYATPVVLELGGKSPCIVDHSDHLELAAKRIAFGKFLNSGQTCVAPDYVLVQRSLYEPLCRYLKKEIGNFFGSDPLLSKELPKIINERHFHRLCHLLDAEPHVIGGKRNLETLQIEPTIADVCTFDSALMQEEIFGPILPVIAYEKLDEAIGYIREHDKPLALYLFSDDANTVDRVLKECSFGGGCINDTIIHLASSKLPFGGVGASGMGHYHGYYSFEAFSHAKSIVDKAVWIDIPLRYHPYTKKKEKWIRRFMK